MYTIVHNYAVGDTVWIRDNDNVIKCIVSKFVLQIDPTDSGIEEKRIYHLDPVNDNDYRILLRSEESVYNDDIAEVPSVILDPYEINYTFTLNDIVWTIKDHNHIQTSIIQITIIGDSSGVSINYHVLPISEDLYQTLIREEYLLFLTANDSINYINTLIDADSIPLLPTDSIDLGDDILYTILHNYTIGDTVWAREGDLALECVVSKIVLEINGLSERVTYHLYPKYDRTYKIILRTERLVYGNLLDALSETESIILDKHSIGYKYTIGDMPWTINEHSYFQTIVTQITIELSDGGISMNYHVRPLLSDLYQIFLREYFLLFDTSDDAAVYIYNLLETDDIFQNTPITSETFGDDVYSISYNYAPGTTVWIKDNNIVVECIVSKIILEVDPDENGSITERKTYHLDLKEDKDYKLLERTEEFVYQTPLDALHEETSTILNPNIIWYEFTIGNVVWTVEDYNYFQARVVQLTITIDDDSTRVIYHVLPILGDLYKVLLREYFLLFNFPQEAIDYIHSIIANETIRSILDEITGYAIRGEIGDSLLEE